jgi:hypothetical protein
MPKPLLDFGDIGLVVERVGGGRGAQCVRAEAGARRLQRSWRISEQALAIDAKERQVRRELENMVSIELPIGVGALSWITLELEIRGSRPLPESSSDCQLHRAVPRHPQQ